MWHRNVPWAWFGRRGLKNKTKKHQWEKDSNTEDKQHTSQNTLPTPFRVGERLSHPRHSCDLHLCLPLALPRTLTLRPARTRHRFTSGRLAPPCLSGLLSLPLDFVSLLSPSINLFLLIDPLLAMSHDGIALLLVLRIRTLVVNLFSIIILERCSLEREFLYGLCFVVPQHDDEKWRKGDNLANGKNCYLRVSRGLNPEEGALSRSAP